MTKDPDAYVLQCSVPSCEEEKKGGGGGREEEDMYAFEPLEKVTPFYIYWDNSNTVTSSGPKCQAHPHAPMSFKKNLCWGDAVP